MTVNYFAPEFLHIKTFDSPSFSQPIYNTVGWMFIVPPPLEESYDEKQQIPLYVCWLRIVFCIREQFYLFFWNHDNTKLILALMQLI